MKKFLRRVFGVIVLAVLVYVLVECVVWLANLDTLNNIELINPPVEIMEGRVREKVTIETYDFETNVTDKKIMYTLCSGKTVEFNSAQAIDIDDYLVHISKNYGCD